MLERKYVGACWSLKLLGYSDPLQWAVGSNCELGIRNGDTDVPFSPPSGVISGAFTPAQPSGDIRPER